MVEVEACSDLQPRSTFLKMSTPAPNGDIPKGVFGSEIPALVGINFGNSYASISVLNKVRNRQTICASSSKLTSICRKGCRIASRTKMASDKLLQPSLFTAKKWSVTIKENQRGALFTQNDRWVIQYIGNQAKPQLIKNAKNTIQHFRNLLGKR